MSIKAHALRHSNRSILLAGALFVLAGCASVTPINQLLSDPLPLRRKDRPGARDGQGCGMGVSE